MQPKTYKIIQILSIAIGTFSVTVLANQVANKLTSEEPAHKKLGLVYAGLGVGISAITLMMLNGYQIKNEEV